MHRSFCRVIRGTCRKWRENDCPAVGGEEIRKGGHNNKPNEDFVPPSKYTLTDAVGWTTGLVLAYEFTHRRNRCSVVVEESPTTTVLPSVLNRLTNASKSVVGTNNQKNSNQCPFPWPKKAVTQPILSQNVISVNQNQKSNRVSNKKTSIDITPFIKEDSLASLHFSSSQPYLNNNEDDDDSVIFSNDIENINPQPKYSSPLLTKKDELESPADQHLTAAKKLTGDLFSVLGAFNFLSAQNEKETEDSFITFSDGMSSTEPPMKAIELLEKGAELGSARALYNIGVAYERLNDEQIAREYYRKASDLGHPLGTYNNAVFMLKDGRIAEGLIMMQKAAEKGVPEAQRIVSTCT